MEHLTKDKLRRLADLLVLEQAFEYDDMVSMQHVLYCDECSQNLNRAKAVADAMDNLALVTLLTRGVENKADVSQANQAVIQIVIFDAHSLMQQTDTVSEGWRFGVSLEVAGKRSGKGEDRKHTKLEDDENSKTFVLYDPDAKKLMIQIDGRYGNIPSAKLQRKDGYIYPVTFEKRGTIYWAEICDLEDGEYELILEK